MDMMELLKMGAATFINSDKSGTAGSGLDSGSLMSALIGLVGGGRGAGIDLGALVSRMESGGLGDIARSWLGDGSNQAISPSQIAGMFGAERVSEFASKLGLSDDEAVGGLSDALPQMVDKASRGGSLLDLVGGVSGALGMAGKLFGK